jgi:hypothetical protein
VKKVFLIRILFLYYLISGSILSAQNDTATIVPGSKTMIETEYELVVFEPGFDTYLEMQLPLEYFGDAYYKSWNIRYTSEWNIRAINNRLAGAYQEQINYNPLVDYGIELDYKLYYFFRFIEKKYGITLVARADSRVK